MIDKVTTCRIQSLGNVWEPYLGYKEARYNRLLHWIKAVVQGHLKLGSILVNVSRNLDLFVNAEHLKIPEVLRDLKNLSMDALRKLTQNFSDIGETVLWEKFDWDDGFDPNEEYIIPAIAMGITGRYIKVVFPGGKVIGNYSEIAFIQEPSGYFSYAYREEKDSTTYYSALIPKGKEINREGKHKTQGKVIRIPFEYIKIEDLLEGRYKLEEGASAILMGTKADIPVPYTLENIERIVQPAISG